MQNTKGYINQAIKYSLFIIFVGYYFSISAFYHSHLVDGVVITHSHPFFNDPIKNTPYQSHQHSASSLINIQELTDIQLLETIIMAASIVPIWFLLTTIVKRLVSYYHHFTEIHAQLRAPPIATF